MKQSSKNTYSFLDIEGLLEKSKDKSIIERREERLERLRFTEWRIWKLLGIIWK
jgi:hypothetical protein